MKRVELLERLSLVSPALAPESKTELTTGYSRFKFDGKNVLAFDDVIAMEVPCDILLEGAVEGPFLLDIMTTKSGEIDSFERDGEYLKIICKAAIYDEKGEIKGYKTDDDLFDIVDNEKGFSFSFPSKKGRYKFEIDEEMKSGLLHCLVSASDDTSKPQQMGIFLDIDEDQIIMYSTNNVSLSSYTINIEGGTPNTFILPVPFCRHLIKFLGSFDEETHASLYLKKAENIVEDEEGRVRTRPGGDVVAEIYNKDGVFKGRLFARLGLKLKNYLNYQEVVDDKLEDVIEDDFVKIPPLFEEHLRVAMSYIGKDREASCSFIIKDNELIIGAERVLRGDKRSKGQLSTMRDDIDHRDIDMWTSPRLVHDALKYCDRLIFTEDLIMRGGDNFIYIVASHDK
jgi:hypothetical protein